MKSKYSGGVNYSSIVSLSKETAREIQELIIQHLETARSKIILSEPEALYMYNIDFYSLIPRRLKLFIRIQKRGRSSSFALQFNR